MTARLDRSALSADDPRLAAALAENERLCRDLDRVRAEYAAAQGLVRLAASVAHDFNNVTTVLMATTELLLRQLPPGEPSRTHVDSIRAAARWGSALTQQLALAARNETPAATTLDVNAVVTELEPMLRRLLGSGVELVTRLDPMLGHVALSPGQLEQILVNLVTNARDAVGARGTVAITAAHVDVGAAPAGGRAGRYVALTVSDTGSGVDAEARGRLFEPYFTTKAGGHPRGLGLAIVNDIVTQGGGWVEVGGGEDGAAFVVCLPRAESPVTARGDGGDEPPAGRGEVVLVVEDEPQVLEMLRDLLELSGYTVLEATDGDEAIRVGETYPGRIDLVVVDVIIPGARGLSLVQHLRARRPDLKALYISGYSGEAVQPDAARVWKNFLQKPFTMEVFARKVREVLGDPARPAR
jgi:nitrogen-specific signal transduction histidine kinase/CheY-like chemotaxis protein